MPQTNQIIVFGGGCFWCTEAVFKMLKGVISVTPGYSGGHKENLPRPEGPGSRPASVGLGTTYEEVSGGETGHAEVIKIKYDEEKISFRDLLTVFFATHDPTTPNRQGNDVGAQYRSIILYTTEEQKREAEEFIKELNESGQEGKEIVTELKLLDKFYEAENYHKDYYERNKNAPYCQVIINPKLKKVQEQFTKLLKINEKHE